MKKKLFIIGMVVLGLSVLISTASFVVSERHKTRCSSLEIELEDSLNGVFITPKDVRSIILKRFPNLIGQRLNTVNLNKIKELLEEKSIIKRAVVYSTLYDSRKIHGGKVIVKVWQQEPIFRVVTSTGNYYVSKEGKLMPVSTSYTPYVIIASGMISHQMAKKDLFDLVNFINNDKLWKAQIEQIYVNAQADIFLVPRVGDNFIELGGADSLDVKFRNLRALYKQIFMTRGWNLYDTISVKYTNQVVCSKK